MIFKIIETFNKLIFLIAGALYIWTELGRTPRICCSVNHHLNNIIGFNTAKVN